MMRNSVKAALVLAAAFGAMVGSGSAASADTTWIGANYAGVSVNTAKGVGWAQVDWTTGSKTAPAYAHAWIQNGSTGYSLDGWLERSHNGGAFVRVSGIHALNDGSTDTSVQTYDYYDGPGYLARACFQFTSWSGAAVHCTPAI
ncbi:hypothetical protein [Streptomyces sp. cg40]|uniref:hypothetical protein n=1 Tax=Streptomyces sp. cg40 TaxID=3419764 RepID=UPI003D08B782